MTIIKRDYALISVLSVVLAALLHLSGCNKDNNDKIILPPISITINPNSTVYQELNIVGGWLYLDETDGALYPSRGIIVYRLSVDQFMAFERTPPYMPNECCDANNKNCTRLIVDSPFVLDTCTSSKFLILDGSPVEGPAHTGMAAYFTEYDGYLLYIHD